MQMVDFLEYLDRKCIFLSLSHQLKDVNDQIEIIVHVGLFMQNSSITIVPSIISFKGHRCELLLLDWRLSYKAKTKNKSTLRLRPLNPNGYRLRFSKTYVYRCASPFWVTKQWISDGNHIVSTFKGSEWNWLKETFYQVIWVKKKLGAPFSACIIVHSGWSQWISIVGMISQLDHITLFNVFFCFDINSSILFFLFPPCSVVARIGGIGNVYCKIDWIPSDNCHDGLDTIASNGAHLLIAKRESHTH